MGEDPAREIRSGRRCLRLRKALSHIAKVRRVVNRFTSKGDRP